MLSQNKFWSLISKLSLVTPAGMALKQSLYQAVLRQVNEHIQAAESEAKNPARQGLINAQLEQLKRDQADLLKLTQIAETPDHDSKTAPLTPESIECLANQFYNLTDLSNALVDAPQDIQALKTQLCIKILSRPTLEQKDQEQQLANLSPMALDQLIQQAIAEYNQLPDDKPEVKERYKSLVKMALFEVIQQERKAIVDPINDQPDFIQRKAFFDALIQRIPDVKDSDIIDTLYEHENTKEESIGQILFEVDKQLHINPNEAYIDATTVQASALRDKLRFGQDSLRDYIKKVQSKVTRDAFWARNIKDIEQFTQGVSNPLFMDLELTRMLDQPSPQKPKKSPNPGLPHLSALLNRFCKNKDTLGAGAAFLQNPTEKNLKRREPLLKGHLIDPFNNTVDIHFDAKSGEISIDFYYMDAGNINNSQSIISRLIDKFKTKGTFNSTGETIALALQNQHYLNGTNFLHQEVKGKSLAEIKQHLESDIATLRATLITTPKDTSTQLKLAAATSYLSALEHKFLMQKNQLKVKLASKLSKEERKTLEIQFKAVDHFCASFKDNTPPPPKLIDDLQLQTADELLLRKLIELRVYFQSYPRNPEPLQHVFKQLQQGQYKEALKSENLETLVDAAYQTLSETSAETVQSETLKGIITSVQYVKASRPARDTLYQAFLQLWSQPNNIQQAEHIAALYKAEYQSMQTTLGLSNQELEAMNEDIDRMARDFCQLAENITHGHPAFTETDRARYFEVLAEIQRQLPEGLTLADIAFEIPENIQNDACKVSIPLTQADGKVLSVTMDLQHPLPYAITKPLGDHECYFSFGGDRGNTANFRGVKDINDQQGRFFTACRALGDGQYGIVLLGRGLLTGAHYALKKGIAAGGFTDQARNTLKLRARTQRTDQYAEPEALTGEHAANGTSRDGSIAMLFSKTRVETPKSKHYVQEPMDKYTMVQREAKGLSYADAIQDKLAQYSKDSLQYHRPVYDSSKLLSEVKDRMQLIHGIATEAKRFAAKGFAHNDLKPENFMFKRRADGSYKVSFIDLATAGYEKTYTGKNTELQDVFNQMFRAKDKPCTIEKSSAGAISKITNDRGQFVERKGDTIVYGMNPRLQILHGARNGTVPYLAPTAIFNETIYTGDPKNSLADIFKAQGYKDRPTLTPIPLPEKAIKGDDIDATSLTPNQLYYKIRQEEPTNALTQYAVDYWIKDDANLVKSGTIDADELGEITTTPKKTSPTGSPTKKATTSPKTAPSPIPAPLPRLSETQLLMIQEHAYSNKLLPEECREKTEANGDKVYFNALGQFARQEKNGRIVTGNNLDWNSQPADVKDPQFDTLLSKNDQRIDDYSLTALYFGVCNRKAYFKLINGRVANDYIVPGILEKDETGEFGLKVEDMQKFNEFFSCENEDKLKSTSAIREELNNRHAVMYIPSNPREGEPVHLYCLLKDMLTHCKQRENNANAEVLGQRIRTILDTVHAAMAEGRGLTAEELTQQLQAAESCINDYEKLGGDENKADASKADCLDVVIECCTREGSQVPCDLNQLLPIADATNQLNRMEVLCTYPATETQRDKVMQLLNNNIALDAASLNDQCIKTSGRLRELFRDCITSHQSNILNHLLSKLDSKNTDLLTLVTEQGLLHYALQEGMTASAEALLNALTRAGASPEELFQLILKQYSSADHLDYLRDTSNGLDIAIRQNNPQQLMALLKLLPPGKTNDHALFAALHLCAAQGRPALFTHILTAYNTTNPNSPITPAQLLNMPFKPSPYHLLLEHNTSENNLSIDWQALTNSPELAKHYLFEPPQPFVIAARSGNVKAMERLIQLAIDVNCTPEEMERLFIGIDAEGKNVINHLLAQHQADYLDQLIIQIKTHCAENGPEVLYQLLINPMAPDPDNKLKSVDEDDAKQISVLGKLFDSLCSDFAQTPEQENNRLMAILDNHALLIQLAKKPANDDLLRTLLQNRALGNSNKIKLFAALQDKTGSGTNEHKFYNARLEEVLPKPGLKRNEAIAKKDAEMIDVLQTMEQRRLHALQNLTKNEWREKYLELETQAFEKDEAFARKALELEASTGILSVFQATIERLGQSLQTTTKNLSQEQAQLATVQEALNQTHTKLAEAESALTATKTHAAFIEHAHQTALNQEKQSTIEQLNQVYRKEKEQLDQGLELAQQHIQLLKTELQEQTHQLDNKERTIDQLTTELTENLRQNEALSQQFENASRASNLDHDEVSKLSQQLSQLRATAETATLRAQTLDTQLTQANIETATLTEKLGRLETENQQLQQHNASLTERVNQLQLGLETTSKQLDQEKENLKTITDQLDASTAALTEAQSALDKAIDRAKTLESEHQLALTNLKDGQNKQRSDLEQSYHQTEAALKQEIADAENNIKALESALSSQHAEISQGQDTITQLTGRLNDIQSQNQELTERLETSSQTAQLRDNELNDLTQKLKKLSTVADSETKRANDLTRQLTTVQAENDSITVKLQTHIHCLSAQVKESDSRLGLEVEQFDSSLAAYQEFYAHLETLKTAELRQQNATLTAEKLAQAEQDLKSREMAATITAENKRLHDEIARLRAEGSKAPVTTAPAITLSGTTTAHSVHTPSSGDLTSLNNAVTISGLEPQSTDKNRLDKVAKHLAHDHPQQPTSTEHAHSPITKPTQTRDHAIKIYASLQKQQPNKDQLFTSSPSNGSSHRIINIQFSETELNETESLKQFKGDGLEVHSPSGHGFKLSHPDHGAPKAVISQDQIKKIDDSDSDEENNQRLAVTMMCMIDNILARSPGIYVTTENAFLAGIAENYIEYLINEKGLTLTFCNISPVEHKENRALAQKTFEQLKPELENKLNANHALDAHHQLSKIIPSENAHPKAR